MRRLLLKNFRVNLDHIWCAASVGFEFGPKTGLAPVQFPFKNIKISVFSVIEVTFQKTIVGERTHVRNVMISEKTLCERTHTNRLMGRTYLLPESIMLIKEW